MPLEVNLAVGQARIEERVIALHALVDDFSKRQSAELTEHNSILRKLHTRVHSLERDRWWIWALASGAFIVVMGILGYRV